MARYAVSIGDQEYQVEVAETGVLVDDEPVALELTSLNGNGLHLLRRDQQSTELYFKTDNHSDFEISVDGRHLVARVDPAHRRLRQRAGPEAFGQVKAPMPGLVVDVLVAEGQEVEAGEPLLIQESMKMQMQLRAPCSGRVKAVLASPGDQVGKGDLLVRMTGEAQ